MNTLAEFHSGMATERQATENRIRIVLADDHPIVRGGLRRLLQLEGDLDVVAEAGNGLEALDQVRKFQPDILLLDLSMPELDGLGVLTAMQQAATALGLAGMPPAAGSTLPTVGA